MKNLRSDQSTSGLKKAAEGDKGVRVELSDWNRGDIPQLPIAHHGLCAAYAWYVVV